MTTIVPVHGDAPYHVVIGQRLTGRLPALLGEHVTRVMIVHAPPLATTATQIRDTLAAHYDVHLSEVPDAENAKTLQTAATLWHQLAHARFTRTDAIISLGGGATTDLAGFVAATWLRGIAVVHLPTTILAMVDAAIGGKTGINTPEGKNLVGAFHPPRAVLADTTTLHTLARPDFTAGLAEIAKAGFIADATILDILDTHAPALRDWGTRPPDSDTWAAIDELIHRSITVKANVVSVDLKESGLREILNYGHTFAHAIEHCEEYRWRHGDAVAVGMVYAAELAHAAGILSAADRLRHRQLLASLDLPTSYRNDRWTSLLAAMRRDKKTRGDHLRFIVLDTIAEPTRLENPDPQLLETAYARIATPPPAPPTPPGA